MGNLSYFERLIASAAMIASHTDYPGKEQAVDQCLEDVEELSLSGRITVEQAGILRGVLLKSSPRLISLAC